ncbi:polysaccharide biosynthesis protein [Nocardia puris]|uniref:polysaccharide biosynthesis protein n=1 Tax=Nocardia puris TaxID=208602 RepID=UPI001E555390|nr:polysaccharide biosynthesis protein [Nocardia puris]
MSVVRRPPVVADLTLVTAGAMTANVAGYLLQLLAGRWLGVGGYSEFASLLAVQLLCAVPALALQNVVARERVRGADTAALRGLQWRCAAMVAAVAVVLVPVVTVALDVGVLACAGALAAAPALVLLSGEQGILQGNRRFRELAIVLGAAGIARVTPALALLAMGAGAAPALWATALGLSGAALFARTLASRDAADARHAVEGQSRDNGRHAVEGQSRDNGRHAVEGQSRDNGRHAVEGQSRENGRHAVEGQSRENAPHTVEGQSHENARQAVEGRSHIEGEHGAPVPSESAPTTRPGEVTQHETGGARADGTRRSTTRHTAAVADAAAEPTRADHRTGVLPVLRAAQLQAALMALSSADLIVVRMVLEDEDASRYALGAIATKIAFWLPAAVGVVLYPRMAQPAHSARAIRDALAVLSGIGVLAVAGAALAAPLAPLFAGRDYAPIQGLLWLFALHGAVLAVLQGAVLSAIAVDRTATAALAWLGLAVEVALMIAFARTVPTLIVTAVSVATVTTVIVAGTVLRAAEKPHLTT